MPVLETERRKSHINPTHSLLPIDCLNYCIDEDRPPHNPSCSQSLVCLSLTWLIPPTLSFPLPLTARITDEDRQQLCHQLAQLKEQAQERSGRKTGSVGFSTGDLDFDNFGTSLGFVGILYSNRLVLLYTNHLEI